MLFPMKFIERQKDSQEIKRLISIFPVTAILGPRQSGKTTLAKTLAYDHYFDLENPRDVAALEQPQLALEDLDGLIVIDEIQRTPNLFPLLRYLVDNRPSQKYLILGSASPDLLKQSTESLAGRISYFVLGGLRLSDVGRENLRSLWVRGGLPRSYTARSDEESVLWRQSYIATFVERDIPQLGISIPSPSIRRFWTMLSHYHGQVINYSAIGRSFGISDVTVRRYCEILQQTFMIRMLQPWSANLGKRLVKKPKIYLRDSGLFHSLQSIEAMDQLLTHPKLGASWEGFALESVCRMLEKSDQDLFFFNTHSGVELDLLWQKNGRTWGVEFKYADAPKMTKSIKTVMDDLQLSGLWLVYPGRTAYRLAQNILVTPLQDLGESWDYGPL
ncbi:MAG: uncharacterized protein QG577_1304 [Thermodesulfobacteriota bacterium]|nr:uncharacterized protein [Thermodesulfobacteriota bacterium]